MAISNDEALHFAENWFKIVGEGGSAAEQAAFFLESDSKLYVTNHGVSINFEDHEKMHAQFRNENFSIGNFTVIPLNENPDRARIVSTIYWETQFKNKPDSEIIKMVVGEEWIVERDASGDLKFVLYMHAMDHMLPDSAPLAF